MTDRILNKYVNKEGNVLQTNKMYCLLSNIVRLIKQKNTLNAFFLTTKSYSPQ